MPRHSGLTPLVRAALEIAPATADELAAKLDIRVTSIRRCLTSLLDNGVECIHGHPSKYRLRPKADKKVIDKTAPPKDDPNGMPEDIRVAQPRTVPMYHFGWKGML